MSSEVISYGPKNFEYFFQLPKEIQIYTLKFCDDNTALIAKDSAKFLHDIISNESFWKHLFTRRGYHILPGVYGNLSYKIQYRIIRLIEKYSIDLFGSIDEEIAFKRLLPLLEETHQFSVMEKCFLPREMPCNLLEFTDKFEKEELTILDVTMESYLFLKEYIQKMERNGKLEEAKRMLSFLFEASPAKLENRAQEFRFNLFSLLHCYDKAVNVLFEMEEIPSHIEDGIAVQLANLSLSDMNTLLLPLKEGFKYNDILSIYFFEYIEEKGMEGLLDFVKGFSKSEEEYIEIFEIIASCAIPRYEPEKYLVFLDMVEKSSLNKAAKINIIIKSENFERIPLTVDALLEIESRKKLTKETATKMIDHFVDIGYLRAAHDLMEKYAINLSNKKKIQTLINLTPEEIQNANQLTKTEGVEIEKYILYFVHNRSWEVVLDIFSKCSIPLMTYSLFVIPEMIRDGLFEKALRVLTLLKESKISGLLINIDIFVSTSLFVGEEKATKWLAHLQEEFSDVYHPLLRTPPKVEKYKMRALSMMYHARSYATFRGFYPLLRQ